MACVQSTGPWFVTLEGLSFEFGWLRCLKDSRMTGISCIFIYLYVMYSMLYTLYSILYIIYYIQYNIQYISIYIYGC